MPAARVWKWIAGILAVLAVCAAGAGIWIAHDWPFTRQAIASTLERRFERQVEIGRFRETWFPPGCVAEDVRLLHRVEKDLPPLISAKNLIIRTTWAGLLGHSLAKVKVVDLHITIPPPDSSGKSPVEPRKGGKQTVSSVGEIEANDAILDFLPRTKDGQKSTIQLHQLVIDNLKAGGIVSFHGSLRTDKPAGEVNARGQFGPWNTQSPSDTPVSGIYQFANADLKAFHGLRGLLSSQGRFSGSLAKIDPEGSVDVPEFHVDGSARSVHLAAQYHASVDVQTADTVLQSVEAHVGHTTILGTGNVSGGKGTEGKTARVQFTVRNGRLEDLLNYFSDEKRPSMTGAVRLHAYAELPPGPGFLKKLRLEGDFGVGGAKFTSASRQDPVNHLSESAQGEKKDRQEEDPRTVLSDLKGHVEARNGTASLRNVSFAFPGAYAQMEGTYNLLSKDVDIHGKLRTDGTLSDAASGFKALVLKVATPFFKKSHTTVVPFSITGKSSSPKIGLDMRNKIKL